MEVFMSGIEKLWHSRDEEEWLKALERYWQCIKPSEYELINELEPLDIEQIRQMNGQEWYEWLYNKYFRWKYTAQNRLATTRKSLSKSVADNRLGDLSTIKDRLLGFDTGNIQLGLEIATKIPGLGVAGASGLLTVMYPDKFGTVDQFVVKALREIRGLPESQALTKMKPEGLSISDGVVLIQIMRKKAQELNEAFRSQSWTPKRIDMILWTFGRYRDKQMKG
jgi:hypothetical protein